VRETKENPLNIKLYVNDVDSVKSYDVFDTN
jgi:hypothetical protein